MILSARVLVLAAVLMAHSNSTAQSAVECKPAGPLVRVPDLPEGSGLAASRRTPGRFWSHNDSGDPVLVALDANGRAIGRVRVEGASVGDWESVAVGPCPSQSCIYIGDIGDNNARRKQITVYRIPEPADVTGSVKATDVFHGAYPDGPHDAEALLVAADGRLHVVTKGETGPVALYRFPSELRSGTTLPLESVGAPRDSRPASRTERVTDGAVSPNGRWVALRSVDKLTFYKAADLLAGNWREAARVPLTDFGEPQGEGVTFGSDTSLYLMSEGGGRKQPGAFAHLSCTLAQ